MIFPGLKDEQKRKDVIAFLAQFALDGQKTQWFQEGNGCVRATIEYLWMA
jgi:hypothetical protein